MLRFLEKEKISSFSSNSYQLDIPCRLLKCAGRSEIHMLIQQNLHHEIIFDIIDGCQTPNVFDYQTLTIISPMNRVLYVNDSCDDWQSIASEKITLRESIS